MNAAIILSGGTGERMRQAGGVPKQYIEMNGHPIVEYCLRTFAESSCVDGIVMVASEPWHAFLEDLLKRLETPKFWGFAQPGVTRQMSIFNGLEKLEQVCPGTERVIVHDAVRPLVSQDLIRRCVEELDHAEGVMPVLPVKDTCYRSIDGQSITALLQRDQLFAGQAPESFRFRAYLAAHRVMSERELLAVNGSSELAYQSGMDVRMIPGEERNFKITTAEDLILFKRYLESEEKT